MRHAAGANLPRCREANSALPLNVDIPRVPQRPLGIKGAESSFFFFVAMQYLNRSVFFQVYYLVSAVKHLLFCLQLGQSNNQAAVSSKCL